jgi:hypothetical protein
MSKNRKPPFDPSLSPRELKFDFVMANVPIPQYEKYNAAIDKIIQRAEADGVIDTAFVKALSLRHDVSFSKLSEFVTMINQLNQPACIGE